jgi:hypothetical protein
MIKIADAYVHSPLQEALRIDATQADVLAEYAAYLSRDPERAAEAVEVPLPQASISTTQRRAS